MLRKLKSSLADEFFENEENRKKFPLLAALPKAELEKELANAELDEFQRYRKTYMI